MTTAPGPSTTWHINVSINGQAYPTRDYAPDIWGSSDACFNLPEQHLNYVRAIHEAGHAVAALIGQAHLHFAQIVAGEAATESGGLTEGCKFSDGHAFAVFSAAGERATDRWLREAGLWTPERAVANEVGSSSDRCHFLDINPHVGFGDKQVDYRVVHDLADQALDQYWNAVTAVADALTRHLHVEGEVIAELAGLPNGTANHA
ncbi:hypothetical protein [Streptomyces nigrescens]|uniref:hypothetical protein n=1 Tax=Streptomyces nigrescens TaxID=1920 RepID=UPI00370301D3